MGIMRKKENIKLFLKVFKLIKRWKKQRKLTKQKNMYILYIDTKLQKGRRIETAQKLEFQRN